MIDYTNITWVAIQCKIRRMVEDNPTLTAQETLQILRSDGWTCGRSRDFPGLFQSAVEKDQS